MEENGDSDLLPGSMVDSLDFLELNEKLEEEGRRMWEEEQQIKAEAKEYYELEYA